MNISDRLDAIETRLAVLTKDSRAHRRVLERTIKTSNYLREEYSRVSMWDLMSPELKAEIKAKLAKETKE